MNISIKKKKEMNLDLNTLKSTLLHGELVKIKRNPFYRTMVVLNDGDSTYLEKTEYRFNREIFLDSILWGRISRCFLDTCSIGNERDFITLREWSSAIKEDTPSVSIHEKESVEGETLESKSISDSQYFMQFIQKDLEYIMYHSKDQSRQVRDLNALLEDYSSTARHNELKAIRPDYMKMLLEIESRIYSSREGISKNDVTIKALFERLSFVSRDDYSILLDGSIQSVCDIFYQKEKLSLEDFIYLFNETTKYVLELSRGSEGLKKIIEEFPSIIEKYTQKLGYGENSKSIEFKPIGE